MADPNLQVMIMRTLGKMLVAGVFASVLSGCGDTPSASSAKSGGTFKGEKGETLAADKLDALRQRGSRQNF